MYDKPAACRAQVRFRGGLFGSAFGSGPAASALSGTDALLKLEN